jgi:hypothetical protein
MGKQLILVKAWLLAWAALAEGDEPGPPLTSLTETQAWLALAPANNPLDAFSAGGRERFLLGLHFGDQGLNGFTAADLSAELTQDEIRKVLALFGPEAIKYAPRSQLTASAQRAQGSAAERGRLSDVDRACNLYLRRNLEAGVDTSAPGYAQAMGRRFDELLAAYYVPEALRKVYDGDLRVLWWAVEDTAKRTRERRHVDAFGNTFAERRRRRPDLTDGATEFQDLLLVTRRYEEARDLARQFPGLAPLPELRDELGQASGQVTAWRLDAGGRHMTRTRFELSRTQILVTASCHFSKDAAADISADPVLSPVFARHARWITLPPGREDISAAQEWNAKFPDAQVVMAYDMNEWQMLPSWSTPNFYVIRDGRVIERVEGWSRNPADGSRQALIDALRRGRMLPATP